PDRTRAALPQSPRAVPAASRALIAAPRQGRQQDFARLPKAHSTSNSSPASATTGQLGLLM
ncbi:MAG: hypothetical protein ACYC3X_30980, partial [Pirellulaceae bacterium]